MQLILWIPFYAITAFHFAIGTLSNRGYIRNSWQRKRSADNWFWSLQNAAAIRKGCQESKNR